MTQGELFASDVEIVWSPLCCRACRGRQRGRAELGPAESDGRSRNRTIRCLKCRTTGVESVNLLIAEGACASSGEEIVNSFRLLHGDVLQQLRTLPDQSVQCVVTSPPYWGLRDYGTARWEGGDASCDHLGPPVRTQAGFNERYFGKPSEKSDKQGDEREPMGQVCGKCGARRIDAQIGLESTPDAYVAKMVEVFRAVRRVLADDGTLWLNLGDSYAGGGTIGRNDTDPDSLARRAAQFGTGQQAGSFVGHHGARPAVASLKSKDLVGIPWRVAFALQADGWTLRSEIVWAKPNPMPESVTDRPTKSHEQVFLFAKAKWTGAERGMFADISDDDARWLALLLDTEGNISVKRVERNGRQWYGAQICIAGTSRRLIGIARDLIGRGAVLERTGQNAPMFYLQLSNRQAAGLLHRIYPFLIVKQRQARIAMHLQALLKHRGGREAGRFRTPDEAACLESLWLRNKDLNHFGDPDLSDVPEPRYGKWSTARYFYDADAIAESSIIGAGAVRNITPKIEGADNSRCDGNRFGIVNDGTRNCRSVWEFATQPYPEAHFATFPEALAERCIKAGTSEKGQCRRCGHPWVRVLGDEKRVGIRQGSDTSGGTKIQAAHGGEQGQSSIFRTGEKRLRESVGWESGCDCGADAISQTVLDPFCGSGTTGQVALELGRNFIGIDLNPTYLELARKRCNSVAPLLNQELTA